MKLPIDIGAVLDEATNLDAAKKKPLAVSVYYDPTADDALLAWVHEAFQSELETVRVREVVLDGTAPDLRVEDDMACVVAGGLQDAFEVAGACRDRGVPAMAVTLDAAAAEGRARALGRSIPQADVCAPRPGAETDDERRASLLLRMGQWVIAACHSVRLPFALAFPFVRRPLANDAILSTSLQNAGVGLVFLIPGADLPVMTLNQAKMLLMIAAAYGEELGPSRVKELAAVVAGGFACRAVARQLAGAVPALGWAVKAAVGYGGTAAMGWAAVEYYEGGAAFAKAADAVAHARSQVAAETARPGSTLNRAADAVQRRAAQAAMAPAVTVMKAAFGDKVKDVAASVSGMAGGVSSVADGVGRTACTVSAAADCVKRHLS